MAIGDDISVASNGDIRYVGTTANYQVIAFHRWLGDLMDDAQAAGNDILDITSSTASERSTDNFVTLKSPYNIDDVLAQHLYDGSIIQASGATIYDGVLVLANAGALVYILQSGKTLGPNFWGTGLNADATQGISHRFLVKVRTGGADIDGRKLIVCTREWGQTPSEFKINATSRGNNVAALTYATDLNNTTAIGTVKSWTTISNTEGYRLIDVTGDGVTENYYGEWNRDTYTINQLYERTKWLSRRATIEDSGSNTGSDFTVGNATITGQGQSFQNGVVAQYLVRVHVQLKKTASPTGNLTAKVYAHSGVYGTSSVPTGGALATSDNLDVATLTTAYQTIELTFATPYKMTASTNYVMTIEYTAGNGSNYVQVRGLATTGTHSGNRSENAGTWAAVAADDLWFDCQASPELYELPGEWFRGITHELPVDGKTGTFQAVEPLSWSGGTGQLLAMIFPSTAAMTINVDASLRYQRGTGSWLSDGYRPGMKITTAGFVDPDNNGDHVISTVTASLITVTSTTGMSQETGSGDETMNAGMIWMQLLTGTAPGDNVTITGNQSTATCLVNGTATERTLAFPFFGQSTGSAMIGAYGIGVESADLTASDKLFDLSNAQRVPPNNVTFTVSGLVANKDRVLVGPAQAGVLDTDQLTLNTTLNGAAETAVVVTTAIPADTPASGTIRIQLNSGIYRRIAYTSYSGSTFVIASTNFTGDPATAPKNVFISYLDLLCDAASESFTTVYSADLGLFIRVRDGVDDADGPIKTFEGTSTLGSAGGSVTAIRTADE